MSEPASPMNGAVYRGDVSVRALGLQGMITLRGDLASDPLRAALRDVAGIDVPGRRRIEIKGESGAAWMSPDELLIFVPYAEAEGAITRLSGALAGTHFLAVNVSDARALFEIEGAEVREVVAKLMPVDMRDGAFGAGDFRRTRMAQIPAAFWMASDKAVRIVCFRSVADYAFNLLKDAALPGGKVGYL